jgi:hypothetical protein
MNPVVHAQKKDSAGEKKYKKLMSLKKPPRKQGGN